MLSVIVPIFNSADTLPALCKAVMDELSGIDYEIILVNDGSTDQSEQVATVLAQTHLPVRLISLRKNFGEHNAVMCGLNKCVGDYAVIIDDDLQNPPSEIRKLLITTQTGGYDVVYARYDQKKHSFWRNKLGKMNNYLAGRMFKKPKGLYLNSFKIISRGVIDEIIKYTGPFPYIDGLIFRCTHNIGAATVVHEARHKGHSG
ncbi:MAG TPA: glycosyltransferase, partial [Cryomorphaceae bacterium]|nr:glycosyltransferase [Cryomorphaceae bacterium]